MPRLELMGAVLLTRLIVKVKTDLELTNVSVNVVLAWLQGHSSRWPPFVSHRVAEVKESLSSSQWRYVTSGQNPADQATRGAVPQGLQNSQLWWQGPSWLQNDPVNWPTRKSAVLNEVQSSVSVQPETKSTDDSAQQFVFNLISKFSSLSTLIRALTYCYRWSKGASRPRGFLQAAELKEAFTRLLRLSQRDDFSDEINCLSRGKTIANSSRLIRLSPVLDDNELLRVGGRLQHANMPFDERHPILICKTSPLANLLIRDAHARSLHGGPQATRALLMQRFWILQGNSAVRRIILNCAKCARYSGLNGQQIMAPLPSSRVNSAYPFSNSGVDYAGPFLLRTKRGRGFKSYKSYMCLFVCLATKAIHLEVVSDLTSSAFLAAFRRFVSRRGLCTRLWSDNGRNFLGADKELRAMFRGASTFYKETADLLAQDGVEWTFIPPYAPHFGGLWEAGVKSVKQHIKRVIGDQSLTFEELSTLLCQIEACLNSRPLTQLSNDPLDLAPLTPGHLLIGRPLSALPEPGFPPDSPNPMSSWRLITKMRSDFWNRWRSDYLHTLQSRTKWLRSKPDISPGQMVLIIDELTPPAKWPMARVTSTTKGSDGHVRVVHLRTAKGEATRPIAKICPLPVFDDSTNIEDYRAFPRTCEQKCN